MRRLQTVNSRSILSSCTRLSTAGTRLFTSTTSIFEENSPPRPLTEGSTVGSGNLSGNGEGDRTTISKHLERTRGVPKASILGNIPIFGGHRIRPDPAPSNEFRPDITWVADDIPGPGVNLSFAQKQARKRVDDLRSINQPPPPELKKIVALPPASVSNNNQKWKREDIASSGPTSEDIRRREQERLAESRRENQQQRLEIYEARTKEREKAIEQRGQRARDMEDKAKVRQERKERRERLSSTRENRTLDNETADKKREVRQAEPVFMVQSSARRPVSETVKEEIKSIQAAHAASELDSDSTPANTSLSKPAKSRPSVETLIAKRVQILKERAGDYSRYLPPQFGVIGTPRKVRPTANAELILARRRETGLIKRRDAINVVRRLVEMGEAKAN